MHALVAAGADVIELGVPFSDPMADGPVIQRASERALAQRVGLQDVLAIVAAFRRTDTATPVVLMGYANPIEAMGATAFADRAQTAGVDGVLVVDYPPEEAGEFAALLGARGIAPIFLLAPTTPDARIAAIGEGRARLRVLRLAQGRDRRGPSRHRGGRAQARRDPPPRDAAGRRRLRHPRCRERAGDRRARRRGGHRQPHHPGDRGRPAAAAAERAGAWLAGIRARSTRCASAR